MSCILPVLCGCIIVKLWEITLQLPFLKCFFSSTADGRWSWPLFVGVCVLLVALGCSPETLSRFNVHRFVPPGMSMMHASSAYGRYVTLL